MKTYFHGTTKEQLERMKSGKSKENATWICSDDNLLYLWDLSKVNEYEDNPRDYAIHLAFESAEVTAAIQGKDTELVVIELQLDDENVFDDMSCENMDEASCIDFDDIDLSTAIVTEYRCNFNGYKSPYIVASLLGRQYFNESDIDSSLYDFALQLQNVDIYFESEFDFVEIPQKTLQTA